MTKKEYKEKESALKEAHKVELQNLAKEYALSQAIFKPGDIIQKTNTIIQIERIGWSWGYSEPDVKYVGIELRKDLKPRQDGNFESIFGNTGVVKLN
jgi:hypothetical protein